MNKLQRLVNAYHAEPTLCMVGDNLNSQRWYWRVYAFLAEYVKPEYSLNDNYTDNDIVHVLRGMFVDLNVELKPYGLSIVTKGGNVYLTKGDFESIP